MIREDANLNSEELQDLITGIDSLVIFHRLTGDGTVEKLRALLRRLAWRAHARAVVHAYTELARSLMAAIEQGTVPDGDPLREHLISLVMEDDNILARTVAQQGLASCDAGLLNLAEQELGCLRRLWKVGMEGLHLMVSQHISDQIFRIDWEHFGAHARRPLLPSEAQTRRILASSENAGEVLAALEHYWTRHGTGPFARYRAFRWVHRDGDGYLEPIAHPDPITLADLIGNEREQRLLISNTRHFLAGLPANNVLLYGDAGTGKSSLVKALLNEFAHQGLRLVEVAKEHLADFPRIATCLRNRPEKFIVFVDDLSFEEHETQYKVLKAALEGTVEARPDNVIVYATSNRRHLVRESFHDRHMDADLHSRDTQQEKLSLADRFGLHLTFVTPGQGEFLAIVEGLARRRHLSIDPAVLRKRALQWAQWQGGWTGRTAKQFVDYLTAELAEASQGAGHEAYDSESSSPER